MLCGRHGSPKATLDQPPVGPHSLGEGPTGDGSTVLNNLWNTYFFAPIPRRMNLEETALVGEGHYTSIQLVMGIILYTITE